VESPNGPVSDLEFLPGLIHLVSQLPIIDLDPIEFGFETTIGIDPAPQTLAIRNLGINPLNWHFSYLPSWLAVSDDEATAPSDIDLMPEVSGLGVGTYEDSLAVTDSLSANHTIWARIVLEIAESPVDTVCFDLVPGWQLISWDVDTWSDDIVTLLADVLDSVDVVLSFESGALTFDPELVEFSTLTMADHLHGFWFRMVGPAELCLTGAPVDPQTPIELESNWNLASYLPDEPLAIETALASIFADFHVGLGFENGGLVYDSDYPELATLNTLRNQYGYWLRVLQPTTLIYPGAAPASQLVRNRGSMKAALVPEGVNSTPEWIDVYSAELTLDGVPVPTGAEISFYDNDGTLCGRNRIEADGRLPFTAIYRDHPTTELDEGAEPGEALSITIDDQPLKEQVVWLARGERVALASLTSNRNQNNILPDRLELAQNYPNPFNPQTMISFSLPQSSLVKLEIFNILGERVRVLADEQLAAGSHQYLWDGKDSAERNTPSGVYLYRLSADGLKSTRKMLLLK
jgi:hypothetical protein